MDSFLQPEDIPPPNPLKPEIPNYNRNDLITVIWESAESLGSPDLVVREIRF